MAVDFDAQPECFTSLRVLVIFEAGFDSQARRVPQSNLVDLARCKFAIVDLFRGFVVSD